MPQFEIHEAESTVVARATFNKATDFVAVTVNGDLRPTLLHKIHAERLIAKKLAVKAKDVELIEKEPERTVAKQPKK